jgi:hypothetical protein
LITFQLKLESEDHLLMVRALANVLLLPWPGIPDQVSTFSESPFPPKLFSS